MSRCGRTSRPRPRLSPTPSRAPISPSPAPRKRTRRAAPPETTLATYKAQNNFVGTQDTLISDQQLSASNQRLAAARAQTMDAKARYDQIEASRRGSADAGAIAEALQSPTIANLRAQYAEARKRLAELTAELGPRHPALRQTEKQVDDLRRTIGEEIDRFAQSAKNDLIRARDYEASLNKALEAQKRQSVEMSQASVRLRELERDVEASRDVYQSFLKRSRETEEQESLNTSAARIIGEATVPQRRSFPPAMSLVAMIGFLFGALAASGLAVAVDRLPRQAPEPEPQGQERKPHAAAPAQPAEAASPAPLPVALAEAAPSAAMPIARAEKPVIVRLQETDILRTLGGILATPAAADVTRLGWPTLRTGTAPSAFLDGVRGIRARLQRRASSNTVPVVAVIGAAAGNDDRSVAALNFALGCGRDDARVLLIDADPDTGMLSRRLGRLGKVKPHRLGWLNIAGHASRAIQTANGISILPALKGHNGKAADAVRKALARARSASDFDLVILDGPAMPWDAADLRLLDAADALVAVLPLRLDINESMEEIIAALGPAQDRLAGVILNELGAATVQERSKQYA
jgi:polysaccharide biosynthesis transport protein